MDKEKANLLNTQIRAMDSILFLPDYLMTEALSDVGAQAADEDNEFTFAVLYMEQILQMFPPEQTVRYRMIPAFEESFMRSAEAANEE